jgi:proteasome beta subunit
VPMPDRSIRPLAAFMNADTSSFTHLLSQLSPEALPWARAGEATPMVREAAHGTTIVALAYQGGVLLAGDRQATSGSIISNRYAEKVYPADAYSCVGVAGTVAIAFDMARLFRVELEHYEKIEGTSLSLVGKANRLAGMIRGNLGLTLQGLAAVPLFVGYDPDEGAARIFSYDAAGGMTEEYDGYMSIGSGSIFARGALKKLYRRDLSEHDATLVALQSLYDASEEDVATMGPDLARNIFPMVYLIDAEGTRRLPDTEVGTLARSVVDSRLSHPDGPTAQV